MKLAMRVGLTMILLAMLVPALSVAQSVTTGQTIQVEVERQRIAQQRSLHEAAFAQAEQVCFTRFAVSDCLRQARTERRLALSELRRQELVLNALDRQDKALSALKRISENAPAQQAEPQSPEKAPVPTTP